MGFFRIIDLLEIQRSVKHAGREENHRGFRDDLSLYVLAVFTQAKLHHTAYTGHIGDVPSGEYDELVKIVL